jgi:hypothetical protein
MGKLKTIDRNSYLLLLLFFFLLYTMLCHSSIHTQQYSGTLTAQFRLFIIFNLALYIKYEGDVEREFDQRPGRRSSVEA